MYERFAEDAREVVVAAADEARLLKRNEIGVEHLLLGLLHGGDTVAATVLTGFGMTLEGVRACIRRTGGEGRGGRPDVQLPFTQNAKKVLERALREALGLGHNFVGSEHILLALAGETNRVAADEQEVRDAVLRALSSEPVSTERTIPVCAIDVVVYGRTEEGARVYLDAGDVALWLSLVRDSADEDERWIVGKIRDRVLDAIRENGPTEKRAARATGG